MSAHPPVRRRPTSDERPALERTGPPWRCAEPGCDTRMYLLELVALDADGEIVCGFCARRAREAAA